MTKEALKLALKLKNSASAYWTEKEISIIEKLIDALAQPAQEPVAWMNNKDFEPIRVRIMQEAYELADRNDSESYNAIKVMCGDVQRMLPPKRPWVGLTKDKRLELYRQFEDCLESDDWEYEKAIEAALRSKNFG